MEGTQHLPHMCKNMLWDLEFARERKGLPVLLGNTVVECDCGDWYVLQRRAPIFRSWHYAMRSRGLHWVRMRRWQRRSLQRILREK